MGTVIKKERFYSISASAKKIIFVLAGALMLRLLFYFLSRKLDFFFDFSASLDERFYLQHAMELIRFNFKDGLPPNVNPLGVIILVPFTLFSDVLGSAKIFMMILDVFNIFMIYSVSKLYFPKGDPLIPALIYSVCAPFIVYSNIPLAEIAVITFFLLFLYYLKNDRSLLSGLFLGLSIFGKGSILIFAVLLLLFRSVKRENILKIALGIIIVILPITIKNAVLFRKLILTTTHGVINLYIGNNEKSTGGFASLGYGTHDIESMKDYYNIEKEQFRKVLDFWLNKPLKVIALYLKKTYLLFCEYSPPLNVNYNFIRSKIPLLYILPGFAFVFALFIPLLKRLWEQERTLLVFQMIIFISLLPFYFSLRYRLISLIIPILCFSILKLDKRIFISMAIFALLQIIPPPFFARYGFSGNYIQLAEINYNDGKTALARQYLESAKRHSEKGNIAPELFEAFIYRNENNITGFSSSMRNVLEKLSETDNVSYRDKMISEIYFLYDIDRPVFNRFIERLNEHDFIFLFSMFLKENRFSDINSIASMNEKAANILKKIRGI